MLKGTLVNKNNDLKTIDIDLNNLEKDTIFKGYGKIKLLHTWTFENNEILLYGWDDGKPINVNRHEFPEPLEYKLFFGDLIILLKENDNFIDFTVDEYNDFYNEMFGGFDTCDEEDDSDLENDDYDYNDGFLVKD